MAGTQYGLSGVGGAANPGAFLGGGFLGATLPNSVPVQGTHFSTEQSETYLTDRPENKQTYTCTVGSTKATLGELLLGSLIMGRTPPHFNGTHYNGSYQMRSLGHLNLHLRSKAGRDTYGVHKSVRSLLNEWNFVGVQCAMPRQLAGSRGLVDIDIARGGFINHVKNIWLATGVTPVVGDSLWLLWRRHRHQLTPAEVVEIEERGSAPPFSGASSYEQDMRSCIDISAHRAAKRKLTHMEDTGELYEMVALAEGQEEKDESYYWRVEPFVGKGDGPDPKMYINMDPARPDDNYDGTAMCIGRVVDVPHSSDATGHQGQTARDFLFPAYAGAQVQDALYSLPEIDIMASVTGQF